MCIDENGCIHYVEIGCYINLLLEYSDFSENWKIRKRENYIKLPLWRIIVTNDEVIWWWNNQINCCYAMWALHAHSKSAYFYTNHIYIDCQWQFKYHNLKRKWSKKWNKNIDEFHKYHYGQEPNIVIDRDQILLSNKNMQMLYILYSLWIFLIVFLDQTFD